MTEKEKMLAGEFYEASDPELSQDRLRAKQICHQFNQTNPSQMQHRQSILKELLNQETDAHIEPHFYCDYGYNIHLGEGFYANHNCVVLDCNTVKIGDYVQFGPNVQVYTATHPIDSKQRLEGKEMAYPIQIGDYTWIGGSTVIMPGVTIGRNTVIGAGSVVTKSIPDGVVAAGNPCKVIKHT
ncbi:sugar O-acetyltransferase [Pontibacillus yanchengensis]|uniref:Acetyltransferase n=1 Tax=Pontibacillus yanchengensis Y32 TaxID=1385514 RepID=A0A0A2TH07_9BACI|nr:sugar O-acetyltransferase [Pontibacillus yanchengensis]KGP73346.1 maltose acetyltransferase [Pontibacillus yanchengensis Y32]